MRLLDAATFKLTYFAGDHVPSYGILSHTWTDEEVTFEDIAAGIHESMAGWRKIHSCCSQALKDNLSYVWVDTCCINKNSSAELQEAINSMFKWYSQSQICYAYLEDVRDVFESPDHDEDSFTRSRWFTRGWTLQELIAPPNVIFFDAAWRYLSSRTFLADQIASATGIDAALLRNTRSLRSYSVAQRFSWAAYRLTTRREDQAYSLLGLFDVTMPLLYGEGTKAFTRLQEEIMRVTPDLSILAWSNQSSPRPELPLASTLQDFASCDTIITDKDVTASYWATESAVTAIGFRMNVHLIDLSGLNLGAGLAAVLNCRHSKDLTTVIALKLSPVSMSPADAMAQSGGILNCTIGWSVQPQQDRVILVDVLEAGKHGQMKNVLIRQNYTSPASLLDGPREFTHLWLRFCDHSFSKMWITRDLYPKQYWTHGNRTFDLAKARLDKIEQDKKKARASKESRFGLPIHGAIALSDPAGNQVAVYFRQDSPSLQDGVRFEVGHYDPDKFEPLNQLFLDRVDNEVQCLQLQNGLTFRVELRLEKISSQMVAHLAVSVEPDLSVKSLPSHQKDASGPLQNSRRRRNPLHSLKRFHASTPSQMP